MNERLSIGFVCIVFAVAAAYEARLDTAFTIGVAVVLVLALFGLLKRAKWGRTLSVVLLWLALVKGIFQVMPARVEGDQYVGRASPPVEQAALEALAIVGVCLLCLHLLGRHKAAFRRGPG